MKIKIFDGKSMELGSIDLPSQFNEEIRPDLIKRAVHASQANARQKYGAKPDAGLRVSADLSRKRHDYKGSYGHGISRVPRKIMSARGTRFNWVGAEVPGTVGGRRAHPPKSEKEWSKKINKKERKKAIRSALSATLIPQIVSQRGHLIPKNYPFVLNDDLETLSKTSETLTILKKLGLTEELFRTESKKVRAGKGKARGRKYKTKVGPLIVVSKPCSLQKAAKNILGLDVRVVSRLSTELLAPGADYGRLTLFTKLALERMEKENLFK